MTASAAFCDGDGYDFGNGSNGDHDDPMAKMTTRAKE